jgi:tetratricopeptide (TPR) repeat protein
MRVIAGAGADEPMVAAKAYDALATAGSLSASQKTTFAVAVAEAYFRVKDYRNAIVWANRTQSDGGGGSRVKSLLAQAYYFLDDFAAAEKTTAELIAAEEHSGQTVTEDQLQILANSAIKQNDQKQAIEALEKLVAVYPKAEYWSALIHRVSAKPGFGDRLAIDVGRLRLAVGTFGTAGDYMELAEQALQAGLPAEAKRVIEKGYAAGLLGIGNEADRHRRLRDMAEKQTADDLASFSAAEREAEQQHTGLGLVNTGMESVFMGQAEKGTALIERGIAKGGMKYSEDAWLHLGEAHVFAGHAEKAIAAFRKVEKTGAATDLARLWLIHLGAKP